MVKILPVIYTEAHIQCLLDLLNLDLDTLSMPAWVRCCTTWAHCFDEALPRPDADTAELPLATFRALQPVLRDLVGGVVDHPQRALPVMRRISVTYTPSPGGLRLLGEPRDVVTMLYWHLLAQGGRPIRWCPVCHYYCLDGPSTPYCTPRCASRAAARG